MTPEVALEKREQMLRDGFCIVDDILMDEFLQELHDDRNDSSQTTLSLRI